MHLRSAESVLPMLSVPYWRHMSGSFFERPFISCVHCIEHGGGGEADTTYSSSTAGLAVSSAAVTPATLRRPAKAESWPMLTGRLAADAVVAALLDLVIPIADTVDKGVLVGAVQPIGPVEKRVVVGVEYRQWHLRGYSLDDLNVGICFYAALCPTHMSVIDEVVNCDVPVASLTKFRQVRILVEELRFELGHSHAVAAVIGFI